VKKISKRRTKESEDNKNLLKNKMEGKIKKVSESNEIIITEDIKKIKKNKNKKIEQLRLFNERKNKKIKSKEKSKILDDRRWTEVRENIDTIDKNYELKKEQISEKHHKIEERIKDFHQKRINEFIEKRQNKLNRKREKLLEVNEKFEKKNEIILNKFQNDLKNLSNKYKTNQLKRDNIK
jgi:hypothetical protein